MNTTGAVVEFWMWWEGARSRVEAAIASGRWEGLVDETSTRVAAIDADLHWEFTKGRAARHCLVVSAGGVARLRAAAARWFAAAPPPTATWEYADSRQADPGALRNTLKIAGHELTLSGTCFAVRPDPARHQLDVVCHHPGFAGLPEPARGQVTFLALDWLLGETAVELWIGAVEWSVQPPPGAGPPEALADAVAALAAEHREPVWALLEGRTPAGAPLLAMVQQPLRSVRWPRFDTHVAVLLPYRRVNEGGFPVDGSLEALREFEDALAPAVGGDGALVAHETAEGRRTLHLYVDSGTGAAAAVERAAPAWGEGAASVHTAYDPSFERVGHLRP